MTGTTLTAPPRMTLSVALIGLIFVVGGVMHFLRPRFYLAMMPPWLPAAAALVLVSGVFEILGGIGVLVPATRVIAGWGLIALLFAVFPANVQMLLNARAAHASASTMAVLVARLPLQVLPNVGGDVRHFILPAPATFLDGLDFILPNWRQAAAIGDAAQWTPTKVRSCWPCLRDRVPARFLRKTPSAAVVRHSTSAAG